MSDSHKTHSGSCHCGAVKFEVKLSDEFNTARRCDCSYCTMRGAVAVSAKLADIAFTQGEEKLSLYQFNTATAKHYFCSNCGIYTHHQRRSNPSEYGINVACIEGKSPFDFEEVVVHDGTNHPADGKSGVAGTLRYTKSK